MPRQNKLGNYFHQAGYYTYLLSAPVTVVYGVTAGLAKGLNPLSVNEFVFFNIDFFGCVPNTGE